MKKNRLQYKRFKTFVAIKAVVGLIHTCVSHREDLVRDTSIRDMREPRDGRDYREPKRREGPASTISYAAPKLSSAITTVMHEETKIEPPKIDENKGYDPFSILRSTFSKNKKEIG